MDTPASPTRPETPAHVRGDAPSRPATATAPQRSDRHSPWGVRGLALGLAVVVVVLVATDALVLVAGRHDIERLHHAEAVASRIEAYCARVRCTSPAGTSASAPAPSSTRQATVACRVPGAGPGAATYVGLSLADAKMQAFDAGRPLRVVAQDGVCLPINGPPDPSRVDLWVDGGIVVQAASG